MDTKIKGVSFCSVYDEKKFKGEVNDEPSETVTTGYIPINEQVKMIMRGEITVGNWQYDIDDGQDIDKDCEEDYFEDATDYDTESELRDALSGAIQKGTGDTSEQQLDEKAIRETETEERAKQSDDGTVSDN